MERNKQKSNSGWATGLFAAVAGVAIGIAGKYIFDNIIDEKKEVENRQNNQGNQSNQSNQVTTEWSEYESFLCPISQEIMQDPVITPNGISYERKTIINWLEKNSVCPITKKPLNKEQLITNYALKQAIDDYFKNQKNKQ
jgi:hypothetical protein